MRLRFSRRETKSLATSRQCVMALGVENLLARAITNMVSRGLPTIIVINKVKLTTFEHNTDMQKMRKFEVIICGFYTMDLHGTTDFNYTFILYV